MFCPNRECPNAETTGEPAEYREGIVVCADCGATLVEAPPEWPEDEIVFESFVPVMTLDGAAMVSFAKSLLEAADIRFVVSNEQMQDLFGVGRFGTGWSVVTGAPVVLVEPSRADEARDLLATMSVDPEFADFRRRVTRFERAHGYYILDIVSIAALRGEGKSQEEILDWVFGYFDDQSVPPLDEPRSDRSWEQHEVSASAAEAEAVAAFVGGKGIGHSRSTIPPSTARELWGELSSFFSDRPRFYAGMAFGDREYAFSRGVVILDEEHAGILWIVEDD